LEAAMPPTEQSSTIEQWDGGRPAKAEPAPATQADEPPPAQVEATHGSGGGDGAPSTEIATAAERPEASPSSAALVRLYLARHDIYRPWYPRVGEVDLKPSGMAIIGTTLAADEAGVTHQVCDAVLGSSLVAAAAVIYGNGLSHACR
jgi:hypothetical protein